MLRSNKDSARFYDTYGIVLKLFSMSISKKLLAPYSFSGMFFVNFSGYNPHCSDAWYGDNPFIEGVRFRCITICV